MHNQRTLRRKENNTSYRQTDDYTPTNRFEKSPTHRLVHKNPTPRPLRERSPNEENIPSLFDFQTQPNTSSNNKDKPYINRIPFKQDYRLVIGESKLTRPFSQTEHNLKEKIYHEILNEESLETQAKLEQKNQARKEYSLDMPDHSHNPFEDCLVKPRGNFDLNNPQLAEEIQEVESILAGLRNDVKENEESTERYSIELQMLEDWYKQEKGLLTLMSQEYEQGADQSRLIELGM